MKQELKISAYGVEEMTQKELIETNGGFPWIVVIGIAVELITLAYTIYRDNQDPEEVTGTNQLPSETDDSIIGVTIHSVNPPDGYGYEIIINRNGSTTIRIYPY